MRFPHRPGKVSKYLMLPGGIRLFSSITAQKLVKEKKAVMKEETHDLVDRRWPGMPIGSCAGHLFHPID
jgi:hypothetical protein